jgi:hypothetical protein
MQMDHGEFIEIQNQMQDHFDGRYVKVEDCESTVEKEEQKIDRLTIEFAKSNTKLNILIGILSTIAVPIIGVCVKLLFNS